VWIEIFSCVVFDKFAFRKIDIDINGLGLGLNWLAEIFVNLFVDVFKGVIIWLIEDEVFKLLQQAVANINFGTLMAAFM